MKTQLKLLIKDREVLHTLSQIDTTYDRLVVFEAKNGNTSDNILIMPVSYVGITGIDRGFCPLLRLNKAHRVVLSSGGFTQKTSRYLDIGRFTEDGCPVCRVPLSRGGSK